ncbi:sensor histidine kinase [Nonomuraea candida]|uniref:sensor histidine kinase n=1 Tax=Nonomuraea candida TaxID=359159 RepID=UPI0005B8EDE8|nr:histidine kinase [Nonomuraea candida]
MRFVLLGAGVFAVSLFVLTGQMGVPSGLPLPLMLAIAAAAGVAAWHARRSWWPLAAVAAIAYAWLVMWPPLMVASYFAGRTLDRTRGLAAYLGGCLAVCGLSAVIGEARDGLQEMLTATLGNALFMALGVIGLPVAVGLWTRARSEVLAAARERAERLEREQVMRAEQARIQERARIAREMHDVVAHRVSLMVLHAGALEVRTADEESARAAAMIGEIGREALANLRDVLGVLRAPRPGGIDAGHRPQPTLGDLDRLLDQTRALGIAVTRHDEGEPRPVEETVERTAYRVIQEALTNVHKHAGDAGTDVRLRYGDGELEVEVRNQAPHGPREAPHAAREALPGAGWGLVGLRERVELLGGTLRTTADESGGFVVSARIPA